MLLVKATRWIATSIFAVMALTASVSPRDAASNVWEWAQLAGLEGAPEWLANPNVDTWVLTAALAGLTTVWILPFYARKCLRAWRNRRVPLNEALFQIAKLPFGWDRPDLLERIDVARQELREKALDGVVTILGEREGVRGDSTGVKAPIPNKTWEHMQINPAVVCEPAARGTLLTESEFGSRKTYTHYQNLHVPRRDLSEHWPRFPALYLRDWVLRKRINWIGNKQEARQVVDIKAETLLNYYNQARELEQQIVKGNPQKQIGDSDPDRHKDMIDWCGKVQGYLEENHTKKAARNFDIDDVEQSLFTLSDFRIRLGVLEHILISDFHKNINE